MNKSTKSKMKRRKAQKPKNRQQSNTIGGWPIRLHIPTDVRVKSVDPKF